MQDDRVHLRLTRGPEDTDPRDPGFQAELREFSHGLRREGVHFSQKAMAFDAVDVMGYPLPEFIAAVSPIAVEAIAGVMELVKAYIERRPGRGVRYRDKDVWIDLDHAKDLPKLQAFLESRDRLGKD